MTLKYIPDMADYPLYNNPNRLPGALCSLKRFICTFAAANQKANDLPRSECQKRNEEND